MDTPTLNVNMPEHYDGDFESGPDNGGSGDVNGNDMADDGYPPCFKMQGYEFLGLTPYINFFAFVVLGIFWFDFWRLTNPTFQNLVLIIYLLLWSIYLFLLLLCSVGSYFLVIRTFWYDSGTMSVVLIVFGLCLVVLSIALYNYNNTFDVRNSKKYKDEPNDKTIKELQEGIADCMISMGIICGYICIYNFAIYFMCYQTTEISRYQLYIKKPAHVELENAFGF